MMAKRCVRFFHQSVLKGKQHAKSNPSIEYTKGDIQKRVLSEDKTHLLMRKNNDQGVLIWFLLFLDHNSIIGLRLSMLGGLIIRIKTSAYFIAVAQNKSFLIHPIGMRSHDDKALFK